MFNLIFISNLILILLIFFSFTNWILFLVSSRTIYFNFFTLNLILIFLILFVLICILFVAFLSISSFVIFYWSFCFFFFVCLLDMPYDWGRGFQRFTLVDFGFFRSYKIDLFSVLSFNIFFWNWSLCFFFTFFLWGYQNPMSMVG